MRNLAVLGLVALLSVACGDPVADLAENDDDFQITFPGVDDDSGGSGGVTNQQMQALLEAAGASGNIEDLQALGLDVSSLSPSELAQLQAIFGEDVAAQLQDLEQLAEDLQDNPLSLLCPASDTEQPPPGFPFMKPPTLRAAAYPMDGTEYTVRGSSDDPAAVINEMMTISFPNATFTQLSDIPGQEAFDFVDPLLGSGTYGSTNATGCSQIFITIRLGSFPTDTSDTGGSSTSSDAAAGSVVTESGPADTGSESGPTVTVVTVNGTYNPPVFECVINSGQVIVTALGNDQGELSITGNATQLSVQFIEPDGTTHSSADPAFGVSPGNLQFITSSNLIIEAKDCVS